MGILRGLAEGTMFRLKGVMPGGFLGGGAAGMHVVALVVLGGAVATTAATAVWYTQTHRPLHQAPVVNRLPGALGAAPTDAPTFQFALYGVQKPVGVAASPSGDRIYVAESDGPRKVHVFDPSGKELATLAPPGTAPAGRGPTRVAVSPEGKLYVTDLQRAQMDVYNPDGSYQGVLRPAGLEGERWQPLALAFDAAGSLYVTDRTTGKHRVLALDPRGRVTGQWGRQGSGPDDLSFPNGLAVDATGLVYVGDSNNSRIQVLDPRSGFAGSFRSPRGTNLPRGVAIQGKRLYVADTIGDNISVFTLEGSPRFLYAFGDQGRADGRFLYPEDLAVDSTGRLYVADRENDRIQVFGK